MEDLEATFVFWGDKNLNVPKLQRTIRKAYIFKADGAKEDGGVRRPGGPAWSSCSASSEWTGEELKINTHLIEIYFLRIL